MPRQYPPPADASDATDATIDELAAVVGRSARSVTAVLRPYAADNGTIPRAVLWRLVQRGVALDCAMEAVGATVARTPMSATQRRRIIRRDGGCCRYCGRRLVDLQAHIDHLLPVSMGGATSETNLVASCQPCNARKGNLTAAEAGLTLRPVPHGDPVLFERQQALAAGEVWPQHVESRRTGRARALLAEPGEEPRRVRGWITRRDGKRGEPTLCVRFLGLDEHGVLRMRAETIRQLPHETESDFFQRAEDRLALRLDQTRKALYG